MAKGTINKIPWLTLVLRPIVRFCLRHNLRIQEFNAVAKTLFVSLSRQELVEQQTEPTVSRISIITGLQRRDVNRLLGEPRMESSEDSMTYRIIGQWSQDRRYGDKKTGKPKILRYKGRVSEFKSLVASVSTDINAATVLFELERIGAVEQTESGIRLLASAERVQGDPEEGYTLVSRDIDDLLRAIDQNLGSKAETVNLHARTEFDNIYVDDVPKIAKWMLKEGSAFHKKVREFLSRFDKDINPKNRRRGGAKVALGAFSLIETPPDGEE